MLKTYSNLMHTVGPPLLKEKGLLDPIQPKDDLNSFVRDLIQRDERQVLKQRGSIWIALFSFYGQEVSEDSMPVTVVSPRVHTGP